MSKKPQTKEPYSILKSFIALILVLLCTWAAQWQFTRGVDRQDRNGIIEKRMELSAIEIEQARANVSQSEWRVVTDRGTFNSSEQILLRNRYSEGVYGFEVLTRFTNLSGISYWVDRGWVKAGDSAIERPVIPLTPNDEVAIRARLRLDSSLPRGLFFALPSDGTNGLVSKLNAQSGLNSEGFYVDLISGTVPELTPAVPAQLPPLSDGPHFAYALQWLFFGGLVIFGRVLIRRGQILTSK